MVPRRQRTVGYIIDEKLTPRKKWKKAAYIYKKEVEEGNIYKEEVLGSPEKSTRSHGRWDRSCEMTRGYK